MEQSPLTVHHVGIAVPSIDDALRFYGDKLGLHLADSIDLPDRQLKVAFVQAGNVLIELLEPTEPDSTVSRFIERRGPGLHHLCFGTIDIRAHLRDLKDKGVELIDTEPRPGAHGEVAFLQPAAALGVLVELLQVPTESPAAESTELAEAAPAMTEPPPVDASAPALTEPPPVGEAAPAVSEP